MLKVKQSINPLGAFSSMWKHRSLLKQFVRRDVMAQYRGSLFGMLWTLLVPLLMLGVYSFVFTVVFNARFSEVGLGIRGEFPLILFSGLIIHAIISEALMTAPTIVTGNVNLVKKVIFPIEILVPAALCKILVQFVVSFFVLLVACLLLYGTLHWTLIFVPVVILPFVLLVAGMMWFLSALGVYIRDIAHMSGIMSTVLLFLSTVFFPASRLPESYQWLVYLNPISAIVDQFRLVIISGQLPDFAILAGYSLVSVVVFSVGYCWFGFSRKGFADVL